jgi:cytoskeletal protein RodZ
LIFVLVVLGVVALNLFLGRKQERDEEQDEEYDAEDEDILETEDASAEEIPAEEETLDDSRFYARDTSEVKAMFSAEEEHAQWAALNAEEISGEDEAVVDILGEHKEDVTQEDATETVKETKTAEKTDDEEDAEGQTEVPEQLANVPLYGDIHGTEAFRSKKDTHYKTDADAQLDILDLNDL